MAKASKPLKNTRDTRVSTEQCKREKALRRNQTRRTTYKSRKPEVPDGSCPRCVHLRHIGKDPRLAPHSTLKEHENLMRRNLRKGRRLHFYDDTTQPSPTCAFSPPCPIPELTNRPVPNLKPSPLKSLSHEFRSTQVSQEEHID